MLPHGSMFFRSQKSKFQIYASNACIASMQCIDACDPCMDALHPCKPSMLIHAEGVQMHAKHTDLGPRGPQFRAKVTKNKLKLPKIEENTCVISRSSRNWSVQCMLSMGKDQRNEEELHPNSLKIGGNRWKSASLGEITNRFYMQSVDKLC